MSQPIPVVVNLSSWDKKEESFAEWLTQELFEKYQVAKAIGQILIKQEALILLLDGLDEVSSELRESCVAQLNRFIQDHGATEIAVCCRIRDYQKLSQRLMLRCSIYIHPLSFEQVDDYLAKAGEQLSSLRKVLETDLELKKIATTPLILSIMSMAYQYYVLEDFQSLSSAGERRQHLLDSYIERMLYRRGSSLEYSREKVKFWLTWLAGEMQRESNTIFLIENLQPSALSGIWSNLLFCSISGLVSALISSTIVIAVMRASFPIGIAAQYGIVFGCASGVCIGSLRKIRTIGDLEISLTLNRDNLKVSVLLAAFFGLASQLLLGQFYWTGTLCTFLTTLFVTQLRGKLNERIEYPNQGIWFSLRSSLSLGAGTLLSVGIVYSAAYWLLFATSNSFDTFISTFLVVGIQAGAVGGLFVALVVGGSACIQHLTLRFLLFRKGYIPWDYSRFLDHASELLFLQKVGGGYIFIHRMLLEHFAQMNTELDL